MYYVYRVRLVWTTRTKALGTGARISGLNGRAPSDSAVGAGYVNFPCDGASSIIGRNAYFVVQGKAIAYKTGTLKGAIVIQDRDVTLVAIVAGLFAGRLVHLHRISVDIPWDSLLSPCFGKTA